MRRAALLIVLPLALAACGRHNVVTQPEVPLAMPTPPPHVVTPPPPEEEAPPPPKPNEPPVRKPTRPPTRTEPPRTEPRTTPKPDTPPPVQEVPQPPPTTLQMPPAMQADLDKQARTLIGQANGDLSRVNYGGLSKDAKGQYNTARRFVEQAQQALKEQNFLLAQRLADKAATIAAVLVGR